MKKLKTINDRLFDSIISKTNNFGDTSLDKKTLSEISKRIVDLVVEMETTKTQETKAANTLENYLYNKIEN